MKDGELCVFREFCAEGLTHDELERELLGFGGIKREAIIADSAEPARIKQMRTSGFRAKGATKGPDSVAAGIDFLRAHKIRVHPSCVRTIAELGSWKYREDKEGNVYEEPVPETAKVSFDAMAALRYAVEPFRRNVSEIVTPTGPRAKRSSKRAAGI
jgi:phage terminase large subunit